MSDSFWRIESMSHDMISSTASSGKSAPVRISHDIDFDFAPRLKRRAPMAPVCVSHDSWYGAYVHLYLQKAPEPPRTFLTTVPSLKWMSSRTARPRTVSNGSDILVRLIRVVQHAHHCKELARKTL